jgi:hypothetical protein
MAGSLCREWFDEHPVRGVPAFAFTWSRFFECLGEKRFDVRIATTHRWTP